MKGIRTLFTVESGCYSDHRVHAVFEDEQTAIAWQSAMNSDEDGWNRDAFIGSIVIIETGTKPKKETVWRMNTELWDNGTTDSRGADFISSYPTDSMYMPPPKRPAVRYVRAPVHKDLGGRLEVVGATREAVEKVTSERIAMWKAGAWAGKGHEEITIP